MFVYKLTNPVSVEFLYVKFMVRHSTEKNSSSHVKAIFFQLVKNTVYLNVEEKHEKYMISNFIKPIRIPGPWVKNSCT